MKITGKIVSLSILVFLTVVGAALAGGSWYLNSPPPEFTEPVRIEVPDATGLQGIAAMLKRERVIRSEFFFQMVAYTSEHGMSILPGDYEFAAGLTAREVVRVLGRGPEVKPRTVVETVTIVVPEGFTAERIADRLEARLGHDRDRVLEIIHTPAGFPGIEPPFANMSTLEGCLFPATYPFPSAATELDVIAAMVRKFNEVLPRDFTSRARELGLEPYEAVIVASLIEREARIEEDRPLISAVIHNRLKRGMRLQIDATVQYAKGDWGPVTEAEYTSVKHPFNTYLHDGLPPHAIAEPGRAALNAAVNPADVNYLFYLTRDDGTGGHYFAVDGRGHQANRRKRAENRRRNR